MAELSWRGKETARGRQEGMAEDAWTLQILEAHGSASSEVVEESGWRNRLIWGETQKVLPALRREYAGQINLIYIDPPFMTGRDFVSGERLAYSDKWEQGLDGYLSWLDETFAELYALLHVEGSLYVHLDWRAAHYAKVLLDERFGSNPRGDGGGFQNEIIWHYQSGGRGQKRFARKHDTILFYTKSERYVFHGERVGERRGVHKRNHMRRQVDGDGRVAWTIRSNGRTYVYDEDTRMTPADVWSDISHLHQRDPERNGYATQKPRELVERILLASSEEGQVALDCCCGSGVTPVVAEELGRRWIACDRSELAIETTRGRLLEHPKVRPFVVERPVRTQEQQDML